MKVLTKSGFVRRATIQKAKGGNALIISEMEPDAAKAHGQGKDVSLKGPLVFAQEYEVELLRSLNQTDIVIGPHFLAADTYKNYDERQKAVFWMTASPTVTINPTTNEHELQGDTIKIDDLMIKYNRGLITRSSPESSQAPGIVAI